MTFEQAKELLHRAQFGTLLPEEKPLLKQAMEVITKKMFNVPPEAK